MIYLITYNINISARDYFPLYNAIKQIGYSYKHPQESTWFIATNGNTNIGWIYNQLMRFLYPGDNIFIAELKSDNYVEGWLTRDFWDWYKDNIR